MSEFRLSFPACVIAGKNRLNAEDIIFLRKYQFPDGIRSSDDVVTILALHNSCPEKCPEWATFFVEGIADFIVNYSYPQGSVDELNVEWLRGMFSTDGMIHSPEELELVLHVLELAAHVPDSLMIFALDQLRLALSEKAGACHLARGTTSASITSADLVFIHRILRGAFEHGHLNLSPATVMTLHNIDRVTRSPANHAGWRDLIRALDRPDFPPEYVRTSRWLKATDDMLLDAKVAAA